MRNTGYKSFASLEQYYIDNDSSTGQALKPNVVTDPDYIAPVLDTTTCTPSPRHYNTVRTLKKIKNDCPNGESGSEVELKVNANQFVSDLSVENANEQADSWLEANAQEYANNKGTCRLYNDTIAPTPPILSYSLVTNTTILLSWITATDNIGVVGYDIYKNDTLLFSTASNVLKYNITELSLATTYSFYIKAKDIAGNVSEASNTVNPTTLNNTPKSFHIGTGFSEAIHEICHDVTNDKIYVGGQSSTYNGSPANTIFRLNSDGRNDTSFNIGTGFNSSVAQILNINNKVYVGGLFTTYQDTPAPYLIRLNPDGTKDTSFNISTGFNGYVSSLSYDTVNNKIYVGGYFTTYQNNFTPYLIRLNPDGTKDTSFNIGTGFNGPISKVLLDTTNSQLYAGGNFTTFQGESANSLVRLNYDGTRDPTFNVGVGFNDWVYDVWHDAIKNKVYVVGSFSTLANRFIRLNIDGTIDTTLDIGSGFNGSVVSILYSKNKLYVTGQFTTYRGVTANRLIRLNLDGTVDSEFNVGTGLNSSSNVLYYNTSTNKLYVGGWFTTYNNVPKMNKLICLNPDGTLDTDNL